MPQTRYVYLHSADPTGRARVRRQYVSTFGTQPLGVIRHKGGWLAGNFAGLWAALRSLLTRT